MKQSRAMSLIEATINIAVGFGLSIAAQAIMLPLLGVPISWRANFLFAVFMTAVSIARQFCLRRLFEALHIRVPLSPFMLAVIAERARQVRDEGWSTEHDDQHDTGELARAGACYALHAFTPAHWWEGRRPPGDWIWGPQWWKPRDPRRNLVRGAALMLAEGEKLDRRRRGYRPEPSDAPRPAPPRDGAPGVAAPSKFERMGTGR